MLEIQHHNPQPSQQRQASDSPDDNQQGDQGRPWRAVVVRHAFNGEELDLAMTWAYGRFEARQALLALHRLGVSTSRTRCLVETGEALWRGDEPSPTRSSVMVRLARTPGAVAAANGCCTGASPSSLSACGAMPRPPTYPHLGDGTGTGDSPSEGVSSLSMGNRLTGWPRQELEQRLERFGAAYDAHYHSHLMRRLGFDIASQDLGLLDSGFPDGLASTELPDLLPPTLQLLAAWPVA